MPPWVWTVMSVAVTSIVVGLLVPRLRRRAHRGLYGDDVFDANIRSLGPSPHGLSQAWSAAAGTVVSDGGDLRWRGLRLGGGRFESPEPRTPQGREVVWLDPWVQVWTVVLDDGSRVELALAPADAHRLAPWRRT